MEFTPPTSPTPEAAPKSNRNLIIIVVVAIVLCCCCVVVGAGGYYGYQAYTAAQQAVQQFDDIQIPDIQEIPTGLPIDPNNLPTGIGEVPTGGLADESTRYAAWLSVQLVGMMSGCETPTASTTTISVSQQPDSNGIWVESWNVDCGNGSFKPYNITFTPENGVVNPTVELP